MREMGRIAIVFPGDAQARGTWSGTPAGLASGFTELGFDVVRVDARPPGALNAATFNAVALARTRPRSRDLRAAFRRGRAVARLAPEIADVRTFALARRLRSLGHFDGVVQIGTGYEMPPGLRVATFEDLTIPQALALDYPGWEELSTAAIRKRQDIQRRGYERATSCCSSTAWAAESVVADYGIDRSKVHAVGLGRNSEPNAPAERGWSPPRFLFVGVDWEGKNGPGVLRAFARLRAELPDVRLDVVGAHPPISAPGVHGHGLLRMGVPEEKARLERLFEAATCFVVPSHRDASAIVYLEAAAAGLPVIGSAAGGSKDLIGDGGCVVEPADDDALFEAMREFSDPSVAQQFGAAGLRRAPLFTWRAVAGRIARSLELPGVPSESFAEFLESADAL
jgi:glycosyltransferase involved in cell wall biosynthesis